MSGPRFPPELFDHTVDFLHDQPKTLKQCCLVSKPWVPRTRKHLFSYIAFHSPDDFDVWKNTFPDPASSPARYTRFLSVCLMENVGGLVLDSSGWIRAFSKVVRLEVPSINMDDPSEGVQVFTLISSLPFLEDLDLPFAYIVRPNVNYDDPVFRSVTSPPLTGTLSVREFTGLEHIVRRLLDLPSGIHFQKSRFWWYSGIELPWMTTLVEACSRTLEYIDVSSRIHRGSRVGSVDLSKAKNLKGVAFWLHSSYLLLPVGALKTITSEHTDFRMVSIYILFDFYLYSDSSAPTDIRPTIGEKKYRQWVDLDHLLAQLHESHGVHATVVARGKRTCMYAEMMLPEAMKGGGCTVLVDDVLDLY